MDRGTILRTEKVIIKNYKQKFKEFRNNNNELLLKENDINS